MNGGTSRTAMRTATTEAPKRIAATPAAALAAAFSRVMSWVRVTRAGVSTAVQHGNYSRLQPTQLLEIPMVVTNATKSSASRLRREFLVEVVGGEHVRLKCRSDLHYQIL